MTVITQPITEKKLSKQQEPLVKNEELPAGRDPEEGRPMVVTVPAHVRRVNSTTTLCVFITALLVLTTGIIGGVYLYRQFAHYKLRHFRGWCSVPYIPDQESHKSDSLKSAYPQSADQTKVWEVSDTPYNNFFEEEFDIDIKFEQYERIEVPDFAHGRRGRFIHDFSVNKTGIIDLDGQRCFIMPLNRSLVLPPHSLFDLVLKMRAGYYDVDTEIVRETMRVVTPPVGDFKNVGYYIGRECAALPTYKLERATSPVYKRSLDRREIGDNKFVEFAGNKICETKIMNLEAAPGKT